MFKRFAGGFTLITAATVSAIVIAGFIAYRDLTGFVESSQWVRHTYEVLTGLETTKSLLKEAETGQRGYVITGDPKYLERYSGAVGRVLPSFNRLFELTPDNPPQQARLHAMEEAAKAKLDELQEVIDLRRSQGFDAARGLVQTDRGENLMREALGLADAIAQAERSLLTERDQRSMADYQRSAGTLSALAALIVLLIFCFGKVIREVRVRRRVEQQAQRNEEQFRTLTETMPQLIWSAGADAAPLYWNPQWLQYTGFSGSEELGAHWSEIQHPDDRIRVDSFWRQSLERGEGHDTEVRLRRHDGVYHWFKMQSASVRDADGKVVLWIGTCTDIDDQKRVAEDQARLAAIVDSSDDAIISKDLDGSITTWNVGAEHLFGYSAEEVIGRPATILMPPDRLSEEPQILALLRNGERSEHFETTRLTKDGRLIDVTLTISPIKDADGRLIGISKIAHDITERKRVEVSLADSAARLRAMFETAVDGILTIDEMGTIESVNSATLRTFGYTEGELCGRNIKMLMPEPYHAEHDGYLENYRETGERKVIGNGREVVGRRKDGTTFPIDLSVSEVHLGNRRIFTGIVRDISARKQTEADLRDSEARLRAMFETAVDGILTIDEMGTIESLNSATLRTFGYSEGELLGQNIKMLMPEPYHGEHDGYLGHYRDTGQRKVIGIGREVLGRRKDGTTFAIDLSVSEVHLGNRRIFTGIVRDISARKQTEADLRDSEARLRAMFETAVDGILTIDERGTIESVNSATLRSFGYAEGELVGRNINMLMPEPYHAEHDGYLEHYRRTGERKVIGIGREVIGRRKDGTTFPIDLSVSEVLLGNRRIFTGIVRDITERKRAEAQILQLNESLERRVEERTAELQMATQAVLESEQRFRGAFDAAAIGIALVAPNGRWLKVNDSLCKFIGYPESELLGMTQQDITHPDDLATDVVPIGRLFAGEVPSYCAEKRYVHKDGRIVWVMLSVSLVRDAAGQPLHTVAQIEDITDRRRLDHLRRARDEAVAATRIKGDFLANMSHEIRTPMNGVIGMTDLLLDTQLNELQRGYAETIRGSGEALLTVINDILDLSKIEAGKMTLESEPFALVELVEEVAHLLAPRAHQKGLEINCRLAPNVPAQIKGDPARIRQVLTNLVGNAVKFTDQGEVDLEASAIAEEEAEVTIRVSVRDTGPGIALEHHSDVFESFTQVEGGRSRKHGGTGLGLAICKRLIGLMGGRIGLESEPGKGSTFWFELTLSRATAAAVELPLVDLNGVRVLVVDDSETSRTILRESLLSWGCRPEVVASGVEALAKLLATPDDDPFAIVLLDHKMPGMDGPETARVVKGAPRFASVPIVLLTSLGTQATDLGVGASRFAATLTKPLRRSHLHNTLCQTIAASSRPPAQTLAPEATGSISSFGLRLLLAEDNDVNRRVAVGMAERLGCQIDAVQNGREAVATLDYNLHQLVLMDVQMPEMDGFAATAAIRALERQTGKHIPIIAMTAHAMQGDREKCLAAGMDAYLPKPLRAGPLREALAIWGGKDRLQTPESVRTLSWAWSTICERLKDSCGDDPKLLSEVIEMLLKGTPGRLERLEAAIATSDGRQVTWESHALKGVFLAVGAEEIASDCQELMMLGDLGDFPAIEATFPQVLSQWEELKAAATRALEQLSAAITQSG